MQRTMLQTWPPLCFWYYHQQNGYYGLFFPDSQLWAVLLEAISLYLFTVHVLWIFSPVPSLGKLLMMLAILESKNKVLLLIQTYIRWQALPQWHQCLWAAVSKIMICPSFTAICICVSSKEIQGVFCLLNYSVKLLLLLNECENLLKWQ